MGEVTLGPRLSKQLSETIRLQKTATDSAKLAVPGPTCPPVAHAFLQRGVQQACLWPSSLRPSPWDAPSPGHMLSAHLSAASACSFPSTGRTASCFEAETLDSDELDLILAQRQCDPGKLVNSHAFQLPPQSVPHGTHCASPGSQSCLQCALHTVTCKAHCPMPSVWAQPYALLPPSPLPQAFTSAEWPTPI